MTAKPVGPVKLFFGGIEIGDVKSMEITQMADTDPNAFLKHMEYMQKKIAQGLQIPASMLSAPSIYASAKNDETTYSGATYGPSPLQAIRDGMRAMQEYMETKPCDRITHRRFSVFRKIRYASER